MATDPMNVTVCITLKKRNHSEEQYRYLTIPVDNESLGFIKGLHQIGSGQLELADVEVTTERKNITNKELLKSRE